MLATILTRQYIMDAQKSQPQQKFHPLNWEIEPLIAYLACMGTPNCFSMLISFGFSELLQPFRSSVNRKGVLDPLMDQRDSFSDGK
jgi:hypothetical protein